MVTLKSTDYSTD